MAIAYSIGLFLLAGLCEIGGGYLVWLWCGRVNQSAMRSLGLSFWSYTASSPRFSRRILGACTQHTEACSLSSRSCGDGGSMALVRIDSTRSER